MIEPIEYQSYKIFVSEPFGDSVIGTIKEADGVIVDKVLEIGFRTAIARSKEIIDLMG